MTTAILLSSEHQANTLTHSPTPTLNESTSHFNISNHTRQSMSPRSSFDEKPKATSEDPEKDLEANVSSQGRHHTATDHDIQQEQKKVSTTSSSSNLVTWDGNDDPQRPMNMPRWRKWAIATTTGLMTFCVTFGSSVFSTTIFVTAAEFHVSSEVMILGVSLFVLGFAMGPLLWGPLSEVYGRTRPMFFGMALFLIFQIPVSMEIASKTLLLTIQGCCCKKFGDDLHLQVFCRCFWVCSFGYYQWDVCGLFQSDGSRSCYIDFRQWCHGRTSSKQYAELSILAF